MNDANGAVAGAGTLHYVLGATVLVDLALRGHVEIVGKPGLSGPKLVDARRGAPDDPILAAALARLDAPVGAQKVLRAASAGLWEQLAERLVARGMLRRDERRVLGLFRRTALLPGEGPAAPGGADPAAYEPALRARIAAVLAGDAAPDEATAALLGVASAAGLVPLIRPGLLPSLSAALRGVRRIDERVPEPARTVIGQLRRVHDMTMVATTVTTT